MGAAGWTLTGDLEAFLAHSGEFLRSRPAAHTVHLTVTESLRRRGSHAYGEGAPVFGSLEGGGGEVRATFFRTPPHTLQLTALTEEAADALAAQLAALGDPLPGVGGPQGTAAAFADAWHRHTGAKISLHVSQRLYRLGTLTVPTPAPGGRARVAVAADKDQLVCWLDEFDESVGAVAGSDTAARFDALLAYGGLTLWETPDGTPVSMAGTTRQIAGQTRVSTVYTPAHLRGRGYAGAVTAEVSRAAVEAGAREVLLFTDLANPTSNGLYQRIGYRAVADFAVYDFGGGAC